MLGYNAHWNMKRLSSYAAIVAEPHRVGAPKWSISLFFYLFYFIFVKYIQGPIYVWAMGLDMLGDDAH